MLVHISFCQFCDYFSNYRENHGFSYDGLKFVYHWHEQTYSQTPVDFQTIIDQWNEYDNMEQLIENQNINDIIYFELSNGHILAENI